MIKKVLIIFWFGFLCVSSNVFAETLMTPQDKAKFGLAQSYNNLQKFDQATISLRELYKSYPKDKQVSIEFAKALGYGGRIDEVIPVLEELQHQYPNDQEIHQLRVSVFESNQLFEEALKEYGQLIKNNPEDVRLISKAAQVASWVGEYETAIKYLKELLQKDSDDQKVQSQLANMYLRVLNYEEAIKIYEQLAKKKSLSSEERLQLAESYLQLEKYDEVVVLLERDSQRDVSIQLKLIQALWKNGEKGKAMALVEGLVKTSVFRDPKVSTSLVEILVMMELYDKALEVSREILKMQPDNRENKIWLARVLSWTKQYDESIKTYDQLISEYPDWPILQREKGRVLGWARQYDEANRTYAAVSKDFEKDYEVVGIEAKAKKNLYRNYEILAEEAYQEWIEKEPNNVEGLFDLAQIYSRQGRWKEAKGLYRRVLDVAPNHMQAIEASKKIKALEGASDVVGGFESFEADSSSRITDRKWHGLYEQYRVPFSEKFSVSLRHDSRWYAFSDLSQVQSQASQLAFDYTLNPKFSARAGYIYNAYADEAENSHNAFSQFSFRPKDPVQFIVSHRREDVIEGSATLKRNIKKDDFRLRTNLFLKREFETGADYMFSQYSDSNVKEDFGIDFKYHLRFEPKRLTFGYRYESYQFDNERGIYFAPSSFHVNMLNLEWRHYLNDKELFWGGEDMYYTLRYDVNFDAREQTGHNFFVDFYKDWNKSFSTKVSFSRRVYEHSNTYSEQTVNIYGQYYF